MPGIDPDIERIIHACLERNPIERPTSAVAIADRLPGGDPLAAAIAKGVVPSPEMVAAAGPKGALHPGQAWALLGAILIGALAIATQAHVVTVAPSDIPKPPEVLAERARNILASVGADGVAGDSAFWFAVGASRASSPAGDSPPAGTTLPGAEGTKVTFVYRQSPRRLVPQNVFHLVTDDDPPSDIPGMATLALDPQGRLVRFTRVVPQGPAGLAANAATVNWAAVFGEAGLDEREFVAAEPDHTPRVPHDTRLAWTRTSTVTDPLHITAATLDGNVVQFDATIGGGPADTPRDAMSAGSPAGEAILWSAIVSIFAGGAVLARYNLRLGQGDRRGAMRLSTFVVCASVLSGILRAHHVPSAVEELTFLWGVTGWALVWGGFTWLMYVSLEPHVRRVWPKTMISWTRLLSGRVRDPLVGRDLLIGMLAGLIQVTIAIARFRVSERAAPVDTLFRALESLESVPHFTNIALVYQVLSALQYALAGAFLLVLIRLVVRKTWIAAGIAILVAIPFAPGGSPPLGWELIFVIAGPLVGLTVLLRFGLLAHCVSLFTGVLVQVPITLDPDAWFFGNSLVVLLILAALATYAFVVSLGGRPAFGGNTA